MSKPEEFKDVIRRFKNVQSMNIDEIINAINIQDEGLAHKTIDEKAMRFLRWNKYYFIHVVFMLFLDLEYERLQFVINLIKEIEYTDSDGRGFIEDFISWDPENYSIYTEYEDVNKEMLYNRFNLVRLLITDDISKVTHSLFIDKDSVGMKNIDINSEKLTDGFPSEINRRKIDSVNNYLQNLAKLVEAHSKMTLDNLASGTGSSSGASSSSGSSNGVDATLEKGFVNLARFRGSRISFSGDYSFSGFWRANLDTCIYRGEFRGTIFDETQLNDCDFAESDLDGSYFAKVRLSNCNFTKTQLNHAILDEIIVNNIDFSYAKLQYTKVHIIEKEGHGNFYGAEIKNCKFNESNLSAADFRYTHGKLVGFAKAQLMGANFYKARIKSSDFRGSNCTNVIFKNTRLSRSFFNSTPDRITIIDNVSFCKSNLIWAVFTNSSLTNVDFTRAKLQGVKFDCCDARGAVFSGTRLLGANFEGTTNLNLTGVKQLGIIINKNTVFTENTINADMILQNLRDLKDYGGFTTLDAKKYQAKLWVAHTIKNIKSLAEMAKFVALIYGKNNINSYAWLREEQAWLKSQLRPYGATNTWSAIILLIKNHITRLISLNGNEKMCELLNSGHDRDVNLLRLDKIMHEYTSRGPHVFKASKADILHKPTVIAQRSLSRFFSVTNVPPSEVGAILQELQNLGIASINNGKSLATRKKAAVEHLQHKINAINSLTEMAKFIALIRDKRSYAWLQEERSWLMKKLQIHGRTHTWSAVLNIIKKRIVELSGEEAKLKDLFKADGITGSAFAALNEILHEHRNRGPHLFVPRRANALYKVAKKLRL